MILLLECGSTKTDWLLLSNRGKEIEFSDHGINPSTLSRDTIEKYIRNGYDRLGQGEKVTRIYHYGAGVSGKPQQELLREIYQNFFPDAALSVENDLYAAARATLGDEEGIVCITGTGSNSCYFDGEKITHNYQGFGYLIGDEGGGVDIGTRMVKLYYSESLPESVRQELDEELADRSLFTKKLYEHPKPNRYLANFTKIAGKHQNVDVVRSEIENSFHALIQNYLIKYPNIDKLPINFVGSISEHFGGILREALEKHQMRMGKCVTRPIIELEKYHYKELE